MKNLYTLIFSLLLFSYSASAQQGITGFLQITVTDSPGPTNKAIVRMKPISSFVPMQSTCNDAAVATDIITGIQFFVIWPVSSGITDVLLSGAGNLPPAECPFLDETAGYSFSVGSTLVMNAAGTMLARGFNCDDVIPTPTDWTLNQWITICTLNIVKPAPGCTVCEDLDIYLLGSQPTMEDDGWEMWSTFSSDVLGDNNIINYDAAPINGPLPLNLLSFTADKSGTRDALISWTTSNEENTSHFKIQRSFDKKTWYDAGSIAAAGYSIDVRNYTFMDYQVYNGLDARLNVYYRLSMVDLDARKQLSPIQTVVFGTDVTKGREFVVYPNPASDGLQVEWDANRDDQPTTLEFFDISGKLVYSQDVSENSNQEYIDFGHTTIQPGLYLLRILNGEESLDHKQIVVGRN